MNPLTGDFNAVVQLSASTINRLLASMHQVPSGSGPGSPSLSHEGRLRIGDDEAVDGVRGTARAQISVPQIELIDHAEARVAFRIWLRIWYLPDPGTTPLPEFSYGQMRAEYGLQVKQLPQSPQTPRGGPYGFLGIVAGTVSFHSAGPDPSHDAEIAKQLEALLARTFVPKPQPLLDDFAHRRFLSLAGGAAGAVAHPLQLASGDLKGDISSIKQVFLAGKDFAAAVSREYIIGLLGPSLEGLRALATTFDVSVTVGIKPFAKTFTTTYTISINSATADWSSGTIHLHIMGSAKSDGSWWAPDHATFSVDQDLSLSFNPTTQSLSVAPAGPPSVTASVSGILGGLVKGRAEDEVRNQFNAQLATALAQVGPELNSATAQKQKLVDQLQTLDAKADAVLESAEFTADGMVLRGTVTVASRLSPQVTFAKLPDQSGYTAYESWAPGGWVTEYDWRWEFNIDPAPPPGNESYQDRFRLQVVSGLPALPPPPSTGLSASAGRVCLGMKGFQINVNTGAEEPFDTLALFGKLECAEFAP